MSLRLLGLVLVNFLCAMAVLVSIVFAEAFVLSWAFGPFIETSTFDFMPVCFVFSLVTFIHFVATTPNDNKGGA